MQAERWKKVEELYHAALAVAPAERAEFLKQACDGQPRLQNEVETLLNLASETGSFLETSPIASIMEVTPALSPGHQLGSFEILEPIGRGGMGEVYLARDARLGREVAIKVLPSAFAGDAGLKLRLEREARILAALNHPRIAAIYGLEAAEGGYALAMEYVAGPTLADRITHGAIPLPEAMVIATQIAEALEYAHEKGVIHRDLKPANIKITPDGQVKVLDFGLAKVAGPATESPDGSRPGLIMGTPTYMAPEQARGQAVDKRADIWAFGVVLYEMVTGKRPFQGESAADTLGSVLRGDPDWQALPATMPQDIRRLMRRCLEREQKRRLRDVGDARMVLEEYLADPLPETPPANPARRGVMPWIIAGALALGLVISLWIPRDPSHREQPLIRLDVDLGPDAVLDATYGASVELSPDGRRLAFLSRGSDGRTRLSTRRVDKSEATPLAGTEGAQEPFFSPDGSWLGFFTFGGPAGRLKRVPVDGGEVLTVCNAEGGHGGSWGDDGTIVAALDWNRGLIRVPAAGGAPKLLTEPSSEETSHRWPQILPGGKAVLFTAWSAATNRFDIEVQSLENGRRTVLQRGASYGRYVPSGHLIFVRDGALIAIPMDPARLKLTGPAVTVLEDILYFAVSGGAEFAFDRAGTLIYGKSRPVRNSLYWLDKFGKLEPLLPRPGGYGDTRLSPDGKRLALALWDRLSRSVWVYGLEQDTMTRLAEANTKSGLAWSPDGKHIAVGLADGIYLMRSDGSGSAERLTTGSGLPGSFTPDGRRFAYVTGSERTKWDLWTVELEFDESNHITAGKPELLLGTSADKFVPEFSPDGRWFAYTSDESGTWEVYVRPFSARRLESGAKWLISSGGSGFAVWSRDGRQLFFQNSDDRIMVVDCNAKGQVFQASKPRVWSDTRFARQFLVDRSFDMSPNGNRAVVVMAAPASDAEKTRSHEVVFLQNMFDELKRKVRPGTKETP